MVGVAEKMNQKKGPWVVTDSKEIYSNPWIRLVEDKVIRPDGKEGIYGVYFQVAGVSALPIDDEGYVYLTEEYRYAIERNSIEAASGALDDDEKPLDAAKRELKEELGTEGEEWIDLGMVHPLTGNTYTPQTIFLVKKLSFGEPKREGTEVIKEIKMKFSEAVDMVMKSEIVHAPTCLLILKANEYMRGLGND